MVKANGEIPLEIASFLENVFLITEIRERVATVRGIKFEVRTREGNHSIPHIHAVYDKYSISIEIKTGKVLAGNLPGPSQRVATDWVIKNSENLLSKWNDIAISATSIMTKSRLD